LKKFVLFVFTFIGAVAQAQYSSVATDVTLLRSFTKGSRFWAIGQTVQAQYHFNNQTAGYAWVSYYTTGHFKNHLAAVGKDSSVMPQLLPFTVQGSLRFRHISLGLRHYFKGASNSETGWSLYGLGGFGLLLIKAGNSYNPSVDTARYIVPQQPLAGTKNVVRLTADVGLGVETVLGAGIYLYADARTWIQSTRYRSPYLYNQAVPRVVVLSAGLRVLFE
jgi:hypothetical protein